MESKLTSEDIKRYSRHLVLQEFGVDCQLKLKNSKVLVIGAGGLGSPALLYLAAAGVGTLGIVDFDIIDVSNLQRQVLFSIDDLGKNKAEMAGKRLSGLNPLISIQTYTDRITSANALGIVQNFDVVVDGTDNFPARYLINDACVLANKPLVYGSILKFEGQVSVFNLEKQKGVHSTNYRDLFPLPPLPSSVQNCEQAGVLGVLPGMIGTMQANEVIKIVTGIGEPLSDTLLIIDALTMELSKIKIRQQQARSSITTLIDYEDFCGLSPDKSKSLNSNRNENMKEITVQQLKELKDSGADFQLIDVREEHEYDICHLDGELIPQGEIPNNVDKIDKTKKVILHCRSGARSGNMVQWLEKNHGFENLYNLKGGVLAWSQEIDPTMPTY